MSERYDLIDILNEDIIPVKYGTYVNNVFSKHEKKYGKTSAYRIRDNVCSIFKCAISQIKNQKLNNNLLLVGKVQSGKTSNLEMFTAMAFDNGYNFVVIYGGYDNKLLDQTCKRFKKTFDIDEDNISPISPELFSTNDGNVVDALNENLISNLVSKNKPIIMVSMKRPNALLRVNTMLSNCNLNAINAFIIDDEGDQASLNTKIKKNDASRTYEEICNMKKKLNNPLYLSVTATPQANVLLGEYSDLKPDGLRLIEPGNGYTGAESFHLKEDNIYQIDDVSDDVLDDELPSSLFAAINYFIIASALMIKRGVQKNGINYSDMIIHTSRVNKDHMDYYQSVFQYIQNLQDTVNTQPESMHFLLDGIEETYTTSYFSKKCLKEFSFDSLSDEIIDVIKNTHIILQDSEGKITQEHEKYKYHKIYIGGDLLQRGLTFEYLITTYFTRWPKNSGNMDTIIQRARWFGYRSEYLDLCKIFTTESIKMEYSALTESENDLWEQCKLIENKELSIDEIVIDADSTTLKPTRNNVAFYKKVQFSRKWTNQKFGIYDQNIVLVNNKVVDKYLNKLNWEDSSVGRTDNKISCKYAITNYDQFSSLIPYLDSIFNTDPFKIKDLLFAITGKKIIIEKMFDINSYEDVRTRTFNAETMRVSALQQGADTTVEEKRKYLGDSHVIVDEEAVTIQIFKIRPIINKIEQTNLDQYMFAVHIPEGKKGFVKDEQKRIFGNNI